MISEAAVTGKPVYTAMMKPNRSIKRFQSFYTQFKDLGITKELMEVGPTTQYIIWGVKVDASTAASTVSGLFAAGEAAAGMHGANRLGGNSLSDLLVFGKIAGQNATNYAQENSKLSPHGEKIYKSIKKTLKPFDKGEENPYHIHQELQEIMEEHVGIVRTGENIEKGISKLEKLNDKLSKMHSKGGREYNPGWHLCLDLHNMIITSLALAKAALERTESRGAHTRLDFPEYDDELGKVNMIVRPGTEGMSVVRAPLPQMPAELKEYVLKETI